LSEARTGTAHEDGWVTGRICISEPFEPIGLLRCPPASLSNSAASCCVTDEDF
jgi:hypothetical protein